MHTAEIVSLKQDHTQELTSAEAQASIELNRMKLEMSSQIETLTAALNEAQHQRLVDVQATSSKYDEVLATLQLDFAQEREELNEALTDQMKRHLDEVKNLKAIHRLDISSAVGIVQQRVHQVEAELKALQEQALQPLQGTVARPVEQIAKHPKFVKAVDQIWRAVKDCHEDIGDEVDGALQELQAIAVDHDHSVSKFEANTEHLKNVMAAQMQAEAEIRVSKFADECDKFVQTVVKDSHSLWQNHVSTRSTGSTDLHDIELLRRKDRATNAHLNTLITQNEKLLVQNQRVRDQMQLICKRSFDAHVELISGAANSFSQQDFLKRCVDSLILLQTSYKHGLASFESKLQAKVTDAVREALVHAHTPLEAAQHLMSTAAIVQLEHPTVVAERNACRRMSLAVHRTLGGDEQHTTGECDCKVDAQELLLQAQQLWDDASGLQDAICSQQFKSALDASKSAQQSAEERATKSIQLLQHKHSTAVSEMSKRFKAELKSMSDQLQQTQLSATEEQVRLQKAMDAKSVELGESKQRVAALEADISALKEEVESLVSQAKQETDNRMRSKAAIETVLKQVEKATSVMQSSASHTVAQAVAHSAASATAQKAIASAASSEVQRLKTLIADAHSRLKSTERSNVLAQQAKAEAQEQLERARTALKSAKSDNQILQEELTSNRSVVAELLMKVQAYQPAPVVAPRSPAAASPAQQRSAYMKFIEGKNLGSPTRYRASPVHDAQHLGSPPARRSPNSAPQGARAQRDCLPQRAIASAISPHKAESVASQRPTGKRSALNMIRAHIMRTDSTHGLGFKRYDKQKGVVGFGAHSVQRKTLKPRG